MMNCLSFPTVFSSCLCRALSPRLPVSLSVSRVAHFEPPFPPSPGFLVSLVLLLFYSQEVLRNIGGQSPGDATALVWIELLLDETDRYPGLI